MKFPPILTLERKLGNLKRESKNEFVYLNENGTIDSLYTNFLANLTESNK